MTCKRFLPPASFQEESGGNWLVNTSPGLLFGGIQNSKDFPICPYLLSTVWQYGDSEVGGWVYDPSLQVTLTLHYLPSNSPKGIELSNTGDMPFPPMLCSEMWFPSNLQYSGWGGHMRVPPRVPWRPLHAMLSENSGLLQLSHSYCGQQGS